MSSSEVSINQNNAIAKLPLLAAVVALGGLADAGFLTIKHYTGGQVPCSIIEGCEQVLTSQYAEMFGVPLAVLGAIAYFTAFSFALLAAFGNRLMWTLFSVQVILMTIFTVWLIYLQGFVIEAFCQFCLISAAITFTLFIIYLISRFSRLP